MKTKIKEDDNYLQNDKEYVSALDKLHSLGKQLEIFKAGEEALLTELREINSRSPEHAVSTLDRQAEALLSDDDFHEPPDLRDVSEKINDLRKQMAIHNRAIEKQGVEVQRHRQRVSFAICKQFLPQHRKNVRSVIEAIINLSDVMKAERKLRFDLEVKDIITGPLITLPDPVRLGRPDDIHSRLRMFLKTCLEQGFVSQKEFEKVISVEGGNLS